MLQALLQMMFVATGVRTRCCCVGGFSIKPLGLSVVNLTPRLLQTLTQLNPTQYWRDLERMTVVTGVTCVTIVTHRSHGSHRSHRGRGEGKLGNV